MSADRQTYRLKDASYFIICPMLCDGNETDNKRRYHSTVVTMTSKVNGTMEILTPCRSETPKNSKTRIGQNDYVMGPFNLPIFVESGPRWSAPHIAEI